MIHGGDIYRNEIEMDYSVNVNPLGVPVGVKNSLMEAIEVCSQYPDIEAEDLRKAIGEMLKVSAEHILCGNGASELFQAIVHSVKAKKVIIPAPSFFGYEKAAETTSAEILYYIMKKEKEFCLDEDFLNMLEGEHEANTVLFLANPNNPIGNVLDREYMMRLLEVCKKNGIYVVLDECFVDLTDEEEKNSFMGELDSYHNLVIVRAFTKSFAIPGVRIGFMICKNPQWRAEIKKQLLEWNTSCFAQYAGIAAAREQAFLKESISYIGKERAFMIDELKKQGFTVYNGMANYLLIKTEMPLYDELLKRRVLIRDCSNFRGLEKGYYRIAVKKREDNIKLLKLLKEIGESYE